MIEEATKGMRAFQVPIAFLVLPSPFLADEARFSEQDVRFWHYAGVERVCGLC